MPPQVAAIILTEALRQYIQLNITLRRVLREELDEWRSGAEIVRRRILVA